jgi:folate-binding protein YgfZ
VPDPGRDCTPDKTYPIEADFDLLNGIDFKKGCFIGQETTSRMHRRGTVKTRMAPIAFEGAAPEFGPRCWRANCARARCFPAARDAPWPCCGWTGSGAPRSPSTGAQSGRTCPPGWRVLTGFG